MNKNLRWKLILIVAITALAVYAFYPPQEKIRLGLDLKGGVHLVLRAQTDDALRLETETTAERLRQQLRERGIAVTSVQIVDASSFRVDGVPPAQDAEIRRIADDETGAAFTRSSDVGSYSFRLRDPVIQQLRQEAVRQALQTIEKRVNALGVVEPIVTEYGSSGDQLLVQLPGVTDVQRAKEIIRSTAVLELKIVEDGPAATREALLATRNGQLQADMEVVPGTSDVSAPGERPETVYYLVRKVAAVRGTDLRNARPTLDSNNQPAVGFSLTRDGGRKFATATRENVGRRLAIILDGRVQSAPTINSEINSEGIIEGTFSNQEVADLALVLKSGALPVTLTYMEQRTIGPTLGAESIRRGILASVGGLLFVALFMLVYYKLSGVNAIVSVILNLIILLGFMAYLEATMTLPGIAGFVLTIGMGVDSNVLIFERIKEELATGKSVRAAVAAGFDRVFLTILDTHVASLIGAGILFNFGTGPIRGFATTLTFGLLANVFTAVFVSRTVFELALARRQAATLSI
ncbi:MAG: protein translocase subunit SecD [Vicinamibacterales bacterium]